MSDVARPATETVWIPGHPGWQGQQGSTGGLVVVGVVLGVAVLGYGAILLADPALATKVLGASVVGVFAVAAWLFITHIRVSRVRIVRAQVSAGSIRFGGADGIAWPLRVLGIGGVLLLASWLWAVSTVPAERLTTLTLILVPVIAAALIFGGGRAWLRRPGSHALTISPERLVLRIPRNTLDATWDEIASAELQQNRVVVRSTDGRSASWAARDLASDPVILAHLVSFYAGSRASRAEIGALTLQRLRDGGLTR